MSTLLRLGSRGAVELMTCGVESSVDEDDSVEASPSIGNTVHCAT
jgi:hypothetical protein